MVVGVAAGGPNGGAVLDGRGAWAVGDVPTQALSARSASSNTPIPLRIASNAPRCAAPYGDRAPTAAMVTDLLSLPLRDQLSSHPFCNCAARWGFSLRGGIIFRVRKAEGAGCRAVVRSDVKAAQHGPGECVRGRIGV